MKITVAYRSKTGHSKKLATAVGEVLGVTPVDIKQNPAPEKTDLMFIVGGIYAGKSSMEMLEYALNVTPDITENIALITSSASNKVGQIEIRAALKSNGLRVIDEYRCLGGFLFIKMGHPNADELSSACEFAKKIASSISEPQTTQEDEPTTDEPTKDEPTETEPTEPEPAELEPTEPEPTEPEPAETEPTELEPTEPEPTEPTETEPTEPTEPTETEPTEPTETEPTEEAKPKEEPTKES